jgi:hypothetical protein
MSKTRPAWLIKGVAVIGEHKLRLLFEDGTVGDVSFQDDPWDGVFAPLKDPARFAAVTVLDRTLYCRRTSWTGCPSRSMRQHEPTR